MAVKRLRRLVIHKPGIRLSIVVPCNAQAAEDIPIEAIHERLEDSIRRDFERAPKRRSRGPYALGPISRPQKREQGFVPGIGEIWPRNIVAFVAHANVLKADSQ